MKKARLKSAAILLLTITLLGGCAQSAGSFYKEGLQYFNSGNYDKAKESFSKALEINGERADYYIDYAMTLIQLGKYDEANQYFDRAILNKNNSIVDKNNKLAYRGKGIAYFKSHNYKNALSQFDKALEINELSDLNMDILYYKGNAQAKAGLYKEAAETYTAILRENPSDAYTYYSRAYAYRLQKDYEKSLADYDKAIKLDSKNYEYYFGKYFLLVETGDKDGAAAVLEMAANIKGATQEDNFNLAKVHFYMGNYDNAISEFSEAFRNGFAEAYYFLGNIYEQKEDYKNAVNNYSMYIKEDTNITSASVYDKIAFCQMKLADYGDALSYIQAGLKYNDITVNQSLKRNEIIVYENMGDYEKAYALMNAYRKEYPDDKKAKMENEFIKTRLPEASTAHKE
ncbi:tetratricopeptide repeat protein [Anaerocolumna sedimenticola]|uniref:Tetratricopeptide repeat protein n=1 Tax=Anaerocolumna sedimenticola TaxID=2696063 RepID=A0A6P1TS53_9FIRM|nr:tetratricopeptide repeat protein [Anaerocolumna sedimenticola]QHQ63059.1 tetratricopeptide repeat protein [Anaerocolumna sedimenticola]